jgi:outer membrane protein TolC
MTATTRCRPWRPQWALAALLLLLGAASALAQPAAPTGPSLPGADLGELLRLAEAANPELAMSQSESQAARARTGAADVLPDPVFSVGFQDYPAEGVMDAQTPPGRLYTLRQMFPLGGRLSLRREEADAGARQAQSRHRQSRADLRARVKTAYAELYLATERLRLTRELLAAFGGMAAQMESRYAQGTASQQELLKARLERNMIEAETSRLGGERARARIRVNMLLARPPDAPLAEPLKPRTVPAVTSLDGGALLRRAVEQGPSVSAQNAESDKAQASYRLAGRAGWPDLEVGVGVMEREGKAMSYEAMVAVTLPIWSGARASMREEAAQMAAAAKAKQSMAVIQAQADVREALAELGAVQDTLRLLRGSSLVQGRMAFQTALRGYEQGRIEPSVAIDALRQLRAIQADVLTMEMEEQAKLAMIERILGEDL